MFNRLSVIPADIAQVQYDLKRSYRGISCFYTKRRIDEDLVKRQILISAARECIDDLEGR